MADLIPPEWEVIEQMERTGQAEGGAFVEGVAVKFRTGSGAVGSVFVPKAEYSTAHVRDLVAARAATMNEISALKA